MKRLRSLIERFPVNRLSGVVVMLVVGLVVFGACVRHGWVWDDEEQVVGNGAVHSLGYWRYWFMGSTFSGGGSGGLSGMYYKPLLSWHWAWLWVLGGGGAWLFHLFQVWLHVVNGWLVWWVLDFGLRRVKMEQLWAWMGAMVWLVHPLQVEAVVYVSALQEPLFMVFGLVAVWRLLARVDAGRDVGWWGVLESAWWVLLAMLSKETGVLFVLPVAVILAMFGARGQRYNMVAILLMGLGFVYSVMRFGLGGVGLSGDGPSPVMRLSVWERLAMVPSTWWFYIEKTVWPGRLLIAQHWVEGLVWWKLMGVLGVVVGLFGVGWRLWKLNRKREAWLWWSWLGVWMVGVGFHSQVLALDLSVAERWSYVLLVGVAGMLSMVGGWLGMGRRMLALRIAAVVLVVLCVRSMVRVQTWSSALRLYGHDARYIESFDLENNYGVELYRAGRAEEAKEHFRRSTELAPWWWTSWNNLGVLVEEEGNVDEALSMYRKAIDQGNYYLAYENYARVLIVTGREDEAQEFLEKEALPALPYNVRLQQMYEFVLQEEAYE